LRIESERFELPAPFCRGIAKSLDTARDQGSIALNLVYQAAEVFSGIEDRAEQRVEAAERDRREAIDEADRKLQEALRALKQAESRITVAEEYATAAEFRAQAAEVQAQKLRQELALVEDAIRRRLLCANPEIIGRQNVA